MNWYWVTFTSTATTKYTTLPYLKVIVGNKKGSVATTASVDCSIGGMSLPITVTANPAPFADVTVTLKVKTWVDKTITNPSLGLTPSTS